MPFLEQGRFADARPILEKACAGNEANSCYLLGRTLFSMDQYEAALRVLSPLTATDASPWRVQDALGSVYEALRRPVDAEREFRAGVAGNKERSPEPRYHYGRFLIREGRASEGVEVLRPAAIRFPKYELVRFELGRALYQLNRLEEAEREIAAAPSLEEARRLLQKIRRQSGK